MVQSASTPTTGLDALWYRDAKLDEIWDGTSDIVRLLIARSLFA